MTEMSTPLMPELPEPVHPLFGAETPGYFTADQLRAYGLAVWKAAMEAAAKECDGIEATHWKSYKRGTRPERGSDYVQGQSDCANECADAIRSLPLPESDMTQARGE